MAACVFSISVAMLTTQLRLWSFMTTMVPPHLIEQPQDQIELLNLVWCTIKRGGKNKLVNGCWIAT